MVVPNIKRNFAEKSMSNVMKCRLCSYVGQKFKKLYAHQLGHFPELTPEELERNMSKYYSVHHRAKTTTSPAYRITKNDPISAHLTLSRSNRNFPKISNDGGMANDDYQYGLNDRD